MTVKYRLNFVMSADVLFGLLGRVLPIEDLAVEEIAPVPVRTPKPPKPPQLAAPEEKKTRKGRAGYKANLKAGTNAIILKVLEDGEVHRTREIKDAYLAGGFNPNGTGSSIERMRKWGFVERVDVGAWRLTEEHRQQKQRA